MDFTSKMMAKSRRPEVGFSSCAPSEEALDAHCRGVCSHVQAQPSKASGRRARPKCARTDVENLEKTPGRAFLRWWGPRGNFQQWVRSISASLPNTKNAKMGTPNHVARAPLRVHCMRCATRANQNINKFTLVHVMIKFF